MTHPMSAIERASGQNSPAHPGASLRRSLGLPLVTLYGLGVTIGAGIYVLIGAAAGAAGLYAPVSFVVAAAVMAFTACSFAEFAGRLPVSAGEAAYVQAGLGFRAVSTTVGLAVVVVGTVSASAISVGSVGYIQAFVDLPEGILVPIIVLAMGGVAAWGISESVSLAALFTVIEIGGLLLIIGAGFVAEPGLAYRVTEILPSTGDSHALTGIFAASLLAFFAFVGFEDLVNIAEEVKRPERTLPRAIFLTLTIATLLYFLVVSVAVLSVPLDQLAASKRPLGLVFERLTGGSPALISAIAIVATLNGIIIQMIMGSRVIYGLAAQGSLPSILGWVNPLTRTPLIATAIVVSGVLTLAMTFPLTGLAETTSRITLAIFALVNVALIRIKMKGSPAPEGTFIVPFFVPVVGLVSCVALLAIDLVL